VGALILSTVEILVEIIFTLITYHRLTSH